MEFDIQNYSRISWVLAKWTNVRIVTSAGKFCEVLISNLYLFFMNNNDHISCKFLKIINIIRETNFKTLGIVILKLYNLLVKSSKHKRNILSSMFIKSTKSKWILFMRLFLKYIILRIQNLSSFKLM